MKVKMKMIADYKDWMNEIITNELIEIDLPIPTTETASDVANYVLFQFSDNEVVMEQLYNIITEGEKYYEDMDVEEVINILEDFFTHLPKKLLELTVIYLQEKYMQYQKVLMKQAETVMSMTLERMETRIGESTESSEKVESIQTD